MPRRHRHPVILAHSLRETPFTLGLIGLCLICLLVLQRQQPTALQHLEFRLQAALSPVAAAFAAPASAIENAQRNVTLWLHALGENAALRQERAALLQWRLSAEKLQAENASLREMLQLRGAARMPVMAAHVIGEAGRGGYRHAAMLAAGAADGVRADQPVLAAGGLVGRVLEVSDRRAALLLLTDADSRVPVRVGIGRSLVGIAAGDGSESLALRYLPEDADLRPGMPVFTVADGGVMPPDLPVGTVQRRGNGWRVTPYLKPENLHIVQVLQAPER